MRQVRREVFRQALDREGARVPEGKSDLRSFHFVSHDQVTEFAEYRDFIFCHPPFPSNTIATVFIFLLNGVAFVTVISLPNVCQL